VVGFHVRFDRVRSAFAKLAVRQIDAAHARLRGEGDEARTEVVHAALADAELLLGQDDDAASFGRFVGERGELRGVGHVALRDAGRRPEIRRLPVAERDRAGLVEQEHVDVARSFDGAPRSRDDVRLDHAIHSRDADRREKPSDRRRNEAHEESDEHGDRDGPSRARGPHAVEREGEERDRGEEKDDGQRRQKDVERDLVRRFLALCALDHRDHPIEECLTRIGGHAHDDPVRQHARAGHDRAAIAARFPDDGRALARDGGFVDGRGPFDDFAVAWNVVARFDQHEMALPERGGRHDLHRTSAPRLHELLGGRVSSRASERLGLGFAATLGHRLREVGEEDGEPEPQRNGQDEPGGRFAATEERLHEEPQREHASDLDHEHDGVLELVAGVELAKGVDRGAPDDGPFEQPASAPARFGRPAHEIGGRREVDGLGTAAEKMPFVPGVRVHVSLLPRASARRWDPRRARG
jgi:hypothetical protein